jgi:hypothetical protein
MLPPALFAAIREKFMMIVNSGVAHRVPRT